MKLVIFDERGTHAISIKSKIGNYILLGDGDGYVNYKVEDYENSALNLKMKAVFRSIPTTEVIEKALIEHGIALK